MRRTTGQRTEREQRYATRRSGGARGPGSRKVSESGAVDRADIEASLRGDGTAYERLVKRYQSAVASQMWRFTRDEGELGVLVQDVFVEAYLSLGSFKGNAPFLHWLRRIATRVGYRFWRRRARDRQRFAEISHTDLEARLASEDPTPSEAAEVLHQLLGRLPPKDRLVLSLLYFDECSAREIAERTGWSPTLVKVRAHRARRKLRTLLEEAGIGRNRHE
jgi:RNA polymerase sigma-70 factor (ECF subfamily)